MEIKETRTEASATTLATLLCAGDSTKATRVKDIRHLVLR